MKVDFEVKPLELARSAAKFCHNLREAVSEWGVIKARFEDGLRCIRAGSSSTMEMNLARVRLVCFTERYRHASTKLPAFFDEETLRVLFILQNLTLVWVRREMDTKGDRFVGMPREVWMRTWQQFCNAYEKFSMKVEFELADEELKESGQDNHGDNSRDDNVDPAPLKATDYEAKAYMDGKQWCTAAYARRRYGIKPQQLNRASTQEKGFKGIIVTREKAQVGEGKRGRMLVYDAGDLQRLSNALGR